MNQNCAEEESGDRATGECEVARGLTRFDDGKVRELTS